MRYLASALIAGWLIFGGWCTASGQVELLPPESGAAAIIEDDDRYGGYVPVSLEADGPQFVAQNVAPAQPLIMAEPAPMMMGSPMGHRCPPWRPCGPQNSFGGNWLFVQTFAGADFRPACARHDACLMSGCTSRKCCDKMFLWELDQACDNSAFPILCRMKARKYYLGVRLFGWMF